MTTYNKPPDIIQELIDLKARVRKLETTSPIIYSIGTADTGSLTIDLVTGNLIFTDKNGHSTTVVTST